MEKDRLLNYLKRKPADTDSSLAEEMTDIIGKGDSDLRRDLEEIWENYDVRMKRGTPDFEAMFDRISARTIDRDARPIRRGPLFHRIGVVVARTAAILFIPVLIGAVYLWIDRNGTGDPIKMCEIVTQPDSRSRVELADGTVVYLNDGTRLRYPNRFDKRGERRVYIDGEAYFEVESDPEHPFVVESPLVTTTVTGTKFNLCAYSGDRVFEASLLEGKITLNRGPQEYVMSPGMSLRYDDDSGRWSYRTCPASNSISWVDGYLLFEDEDLKSVARKLGRWYEADVVILDQRLADKPLTAKISRESLEQVLRSMARALPISYTIVSDPQTGRRTVYLDHR